MPAEHNVNLGALLGQVDIGSEAQVRQCNNQVGALLLQSGDGLLRGGNHVVETRQIAGVRPVRREESSVISKRQTQQQQQRTNSFGVAGVQTPKTPRRNPDRVTTTLRSMHPGSILFSGSLVTLAPYQSNFDSPMRLSRTLVEKSN